MTLENKALLKVWREYKKTYGGTPWSDKEISEVIRILMSNDVFAVFYVEHGLEKMSNIDKVRLIERFVNDAMQKNVESNLESRSDAK